MPTYEYRCTDCSTEFELFQKMSDEPKADCPRCSAPSQRKLSGGAGLLFKGSGFYITDYRGEGYKKAAKAEGGASSGSDSSSSTAPSTSTATPAKSD